MLPSNGPQWGGCPQRDRQRQPRPRLCGRLRGRHWRFCRRGCGRAGARPWVRAGCRVFEDGARGRSEAAGHRHACVWSSCCGRPFGTRQYLQDVMRSRTVHDAVLQRCVTSKREADYILRNRPRSFVLQLCNATGHSGCGGVDRLCTRYPCVGGRGDAGRAGMTLPQEVAVGLEAQVQQGVLVLDVIEQCTGGGVPPFLVVWL